MKILIIGEHDGETLKAVNEPVLQAASLLDKDIDLLIVGYQCDAIIAQAKELPLLQRILVADHATYEHQLAENMASLLISIANEYEYILCASTTFGKNILPRVAALLNVNMLGDVTKIIAADTFERPMYAGNILATVILNEKIKLLTIRTSAFAALSKKLNTSPEIVKLTTVIENKQSEWVASKLTPLTRPELTSADIIVSGGRGFKNKDSFQLLDQLADQLGAALGATRAAVDAGYVSNDYQVGQTGKMVAPHLYLAIGISGAIQHLAGIKDSKIIVAINSDPDAPIFAAADYYLVGDLFVILPELIQALS